MTAQTKGTGGCAPPPPPSLRTTGVGRRGGEARCARRVPQRSPGKGVGGRRFRCGPRPWPRARSSVSSRSAHRGEGGSCAPALAVCKPPPPQKKRHSGFGGGGCAAWPVVTAPPKNKNKSTPFGPLEPGAWPQRGRGGGCVRALPVAVISHPRPKPKTLGRLEWCLNEADEARWRPPHP
jgi:hypothetical protein